MGFREILGWLTKRSGIFVTIGAVLFIVTQLLDIVQAVGITINLPAYIEYFKTSSIEAKLYVFSLLNFMLTIILFIFIRNGNKTKNSPKTKQEEKDPPIQ